MQPLDFLLNRVELFLAVQRCLKSGNRSVFSADHIESQGKKWYNGLRIRDKTGKGQYRLFPFRQGADDQIQLPVQQLILIL